MSLKITIVIHSAGTAAAEGVIAVRVFSLPLAVRVFSLCLFAQLTIEKIVRNDEVLCGW